MHRFVSFIGLLFLMGVAFGLSTSRKSVRWRTIVVGIVLQFLIGVLVIRTAAGQAFFRHVCSAVDDLIQFSDEGSRFVFGSLTDVKKFGMIFAIGVLPPIIVISALMSILYYMGVMQRFVKWTAWAMSKLMKTSGSETVAAAANIFLGPGAAALTVKPYIDKMTRSELMVLMTYALCGFSNLSIIGMSIGAVAAIAPKRQGELARLSLRALVAANLACFMTACVAGVLL